MVHASRRLHEAAGTEERGRRSWTGTLTGREWYLRPRRGSRGMVHLCEVAWRWWESHECHEGRWIRAIWNPSGRSQWSSFRGGNEISKGRCVSRQRAQLTHPWYRCPSDRSSASCSLAKSSAQARGLAVSLLRPPFLLHGCPSPRQARLRAAQTRLGNRPCSNDAAVLRRRALSKAGSVARIGVCWPTESRRWMVADV